MTLFLVRLLQGFRFPEVAFDWRRSPYPPIVRAFATREAAESFVLENVPIWQNPFDTRAIYISQKEIETWHWDEDLYDREHPEADNQVTPMHVFRQTLDELGVMPPTLLPAQDEESLQSTLVRWWDSTPMTDAQKTALWRLLDPHPYRIDEVELF